MSDDQVQHIQEQQEQPRKSGKSPIVYTMGQATAQEGMPEYDNDDSDHAGDHGGDGPAVAKPPRARGMRKVWIKQPGNQYALGALMFSIFGIRANWSETVSLQGSIEATATIEDAMVHLQADARDIESADATKSSFHDFYEGFLDARDKQISTMRRMTREPIGPPEKKQKIGPK